MTSVQNTTLHVNTATCLRKATQLPLNVSPQAPFSYRHSSFKPSMNFLPPTLSIPKHRIFKEGKNPNENCHQRCTFVESLELGLTLNNMQSCTEMTEVAPRAFQQCYQQI